MPKTFAALLFRDALATTERPIIRAAQTDRAVAYPLVRLTIGASLFGHGLVRMPKLTAFHAQLMGEFTKSMVPTFLVYACSYVLL
jgi:thiosulfate dehydrogenase (quinone) large subunit